MESSSDLWSFLTACKPISLYPHLSAQKKNHSLDDMFKPTVSPHIPSIHIFLLSLSCPAKERRNGIRAKWQYQWLCPGSTNGLSDKWCCRAAASAPWHHKWVWGEWTGTASPEGHMQIWIRPSLGKLFYQSPNGSKQQREESNQWKVVVEGDTQKQPGMEMRQDSINPMLIWTQNLPHVGLPP